LNRPTEPGLPRGLREELDSSSRSDGPRRVASLLSRRAPLTDPRVQLERLAGADLGGEFESDLAAAGHDGLLASGIEVLQLNLGRLCNMTCAHCHVDAGPDRVDEIMDRETVELCLAALDRTRARAVDLTGGAPELNPHFRYLVEEVVRRGKHVIDRCNLTVLTLPRFRDLPGWLAERGVEVACSLPHVRRLNTDAQRGDGTFAKSIEALRLLNAAGYGQGDPRRRLTLVSNPAGAFLAGNQASMEREWKRALAAHHGVQFDRLIALNNMPIARFLDWLESTGNLEPYLARLRAAFNPGTVAGLMCRTTLSVSWDGRIFDCDFNQMLDLESRPTGSGRPHVRDFDPAALAGREIVTGRHCYGCTAGAGSSCGGALDAD
jgi:radical SAM/Cys-rich protein